MSDGGALPLAGRRVVVTRPRAQAEALVGALEELGAEVLAMPIIRIAGPTDPEPLRAAVRDARSFHWIVFTSANGVERFWAQLRADGRDASLLRDVSLCAIGPATAAALQREGARPDLVPPEYVGEAVVEALAEATDLKGARILLPRAEVARSIVPDALRQRGAEVTDVAAYRTVADEAGLSELAGWIRTGSVDLLTFTASSSVRFFVETVGADVGSVDVAVIGPITARTARELGLRVHIEAEESTVQGLVSSIVTYYRQPGGTS